MANGIILSSFTWTSPGGGQYPSSGDTLDIEDSGYSLAVLLQTNELVGGVGPAGPQLGMLGYIHNDFKIIAQNTSDLRDAALRMMYNLDRLDKEIQVVTAGINQRNQLMASLIANQVQTTNFFKAGNVDTPQMPGIREQLTTGVVDSVKLTEISITSGSVSNYIYTLSSQLKDFILGLETFKTVTRWIGISETVTKIPFTPSPTNLKRRAALDSGTDPVE